MKNLLTMLLVLSTAFSAKAASLSGAVLDSQTDEPIDGATVILGTLQNFGNTIQDTVGTATTRGDGSYSFDSISPGRYAVVASAIGYTTNQENTRIFTEGENADLDVALEPTDASGTIEATVTDSDSDEPIQAAFCTLEQWVGTAQEGYWMHVNSRTTNAEGYVFFDEMPTSLAYHLLCRADGYVSIETDFFILDQDETETLEIGMDIYVPPTGAISGTVTSAADDEPVAGARVILRTGSGSLGGDITWTNAYSVLTAADGSYMFTVLAPSSPTNRYSIVVSHDDFVTYTSGPIPVDEDTATADAALEGRTVGNLIVTVLDDADDTPLENAMVNAALEGGSGEVYTATTDESGLAVIEGALTGNYTLTVILTGYVTETQGRRLDEGEDDMATVLLAASTVDNSKTLMGTLTGPDDAVIAGGQIILQSGNPTEILTLSATSDSEGNYIITGIPINVTNAALEFIASGYVSLAQTVILSDDTSSVDAQLDLDATQVLNPGQGFTLPGIQFTPGSPVLIINNIKSKGRVIIANIKGKLISSLVLEPGVNRRVNLQESSSGSLLLINYRSGSFSQTVKKLVP